MAKPKQTARNNYETTPTTPPAVRNNPRAAGNSSALANSPGARFTWARKHRQVIKLMVEHFRFDWDRAHLVFNAMFREACITYGFPRGLEKNKIIIQYHDRVRSSSKGWQEAEFLNKKEREQVIGEVQHVHELLTKRNQRSSPSTPTKSKPIQLPTPRSYETPRMTARVVIPVSPTKQVVKQTRSVFQNGSSVRRDTTRIVFGKEINLVTPDSPDISAFPFQPITTAEAHPPIPAVMFRFYDDASRGRNGQEGFIAGSCIKLTTEFPPPPKFSDPYILTLVETHFHKHHIASPLISTTSNLFFALRLATRSNAPSRRISILRGSIVAAGNHAFHAHPYDKRLKALRAYVDGVWMNAALHEYLVWARIPSAAVMCDFSLEDLQRQLSRIPRMQAALRLDQMIATKVASNKTIQDSFKQNPVALTDVLTRELAKILLAFNIDASTDPAIIAKLIAEFIRGWEIVIPKDYNARWYLLAGVFAYALTNKYPEVSEQQLDVVKEAFLLGLESGLGPQNWHLDLKKMATMQRKAETRGLGANRRLVEGTRIEAGPSRKAIQAPPPLQEPPSGDFVNLVSDDEEYFVENKVGRGHGHMDNTTLHFGADDLMDEDYLEDEDEDTMVSYDEEE